MARIPKLDSAGRFLAADVNAQIDARTKATMRADLPALAEELKIGGGGVDGSVPIFPTLAEAEAWEAKNPGKTALTLEPSTPDTTAPTAGSLSVTTSQTSATLTVSGASDDRGVTGYAFKVGSGAWSAWQDSGSYTASGLTHSTSYTFQHKVKDAAGNETLGASVVKSTTAAPVADTTAPAWSATLTVGTPSETSVVVTASALATDNVGVTGYEVTYNGTAWSSITPSGKNFTLSGTAGTAYSSTKLRAKDAAGNVSTALSVPSYTMAATPPAPPTVDTFSQDGSMIGRLAESGDASWVASSADVWSSTLSTGSEPLAAQGGVATGPGRAAIDRKATNGTLKATFSVTGSGALRLGAALATTASVAGGTAAVVLKITSGQISLDVADSGASILTTKASQPGTFTSGEATLAVNGKQVTATVAGTTISCTLTGDPVGTLWGLWLYNGVTVDRFEVTA